MPPSTALACGGRKEATMTNEEKLAYVGRRAYELAAAGEHEDFAEIQRAIMKEGHAELVPWLEKPGVIDAIRCRGGSGAQGRTAGKKDARHQLPNRSRDDLAAAGYACVRDELKNIQVTVTSDYSPDLAEAQVR